LTIRKLIIVQCSHAHAAPRASTQASVPALLSSCTWQRAGSDALSHPLRLQPNGPK
jgi:hypothetical protein